MVSGDPQIGLRLFLGLGLDLEEIELERPHDLAGRRHDTGRSDDRGDGGENVAHLLGVDVELARDSEVLGLVFRSVLEWSLLLLE